MKNQFVDDLQNIKRYLHTNVFDHTFNGDDRDEANVDYFIDMIERKYKPI